MPRQSASVTPQAFESFHELLRFLRKQAELNQRELALQVGYHFSYLSRIEAGERIPDRATIQARFIPALDLEDRPDWAARLLALAEPGRAHKTTGPAGATPGEPLEPPSAPAPLPRPVTALLGREAEVRAVEELLARPDSRLVTLLGPPGVGKTRLAVEAAARFAAGSGGAAAFIDLSPVREPERLADVLAAALQLTESGGTTPAQAITSALARRELLLVLDNFEQIIPAAVFAAELLEAAPKVKILATSRENLRIAGEIEYRVPPLPVGSESPAVALFIDRARRVRPDLEIGREMLEAISALCARLDGLPLAIELAAARVKLMEPQAMLDRLDRRLEWLSGGRRDDRPDRASLRQALDWSYELCSGAEQDLFVRLGVFAGGFDLDAAVSLGGGGPVIVDALAGLVDKSLVVPAGGEGTGPRFKLLETIREYALEHLDGMPAGPEPVRRSHALYYLNWIRIGPGAELPDRDWYSRVAGEYDNIRLALRWLLEHEPESGLRLADRLRIFWSERSLFHEALPWLESSLALAVGELAHPWRMRFAEMAGLTHWNLGNLALARRYLQECLQLARAVPPEGDPEMMSASLALLGRLEFSSADNLSAGRLMQEGLEIARAHGLVAHQVRILRYLSMHFINVHQLEDANRALDEAIDLAEAHGEAAGLPPLFNMKGIVALERGDHARAREALSEALYLFRAYPNARGEGVAYQNLGGLELSEGQTARARVYLEQSLKIAIDHGINIVAAETLDYLGRVALAENDLPAARRYLLDELLLALEIDSIRRGLDALAGLGVVRLRMGEVREALERFDSVLGSPAVRGDTVDFLRPFVAEARLLLPERTGSPPAEPGGDWRRIAYVELAQPPSTGE